MNPPATTRRNVLKTAAAGVAAFVLGRPIAAAAGTAAVLKIDAPFDGAVLNRRHGQAVDGCLQIHVSGKAPPGDRVTVNSVRA